MEREGKRLRAEHLEVRLVASLLPHPRVGFVVPKYSHTAVERNRLKRRLRELTRVRLLPAAPPADLVVRARRSAYDASFERLAADVARIIRQLAPAGLPGRER